MPIISLWKCTTIRQVHYFFQQCHMHNPYIIEYQITCSLISQYHQISPFSDMGMYQYLLIPILVEWTSIYQLFWCSPRVQGFDTLPYYVTSPKIEWSNPNYQSFGTLFLPPRAGILWPVELVTLAASKTKGFSASDEAELVGKLSHHDGDIS